MPKIDQTEENGTRHQKGDWVRAALLIAIALIGPPLARLVGACPDTPEANACSSEQALIASWPTLIVWLAAISVAMYSAYVARTDKGRQRSLVACAILVAGSLLFVALESLLVDQAISSVATAAIVAIAGALIVSGFNAHNESESDSGPSGVRSPPRPDAVLSQLEVLNHYLAWWETEYARARRVVKRRASLVTIWTTSLSGLVAVLGAIGAALATNIWVEVISVATTAASATAAVLLAWNGHFHHAELWVQRTGVLNQLQALRLDLELSLRDGAGEHARGDTSTDSLAATLKDILERDAETWARIQGSSR